MSNTRNNSIDIFRLVCAILVVAIHTEPFYDVSENVGMVMTMVLPRIAVPFFFVVAGFFYVKKLNTGKSPFIPYLLRTIMVYFIWSIPYWVIDLVNGVNSEGFYFVSFAKGCVFNFLFLGSYYHFWFFPALILSVMVTTLFYKTKLQKVLYIIAPILFVVGCLGEAYYAIGVRIPVLSSLIAAGDWFEWFRRIFSMGIPFFCLGGLLSTKVGFMERLKPKTTWWILACTVLLYFAELIAVTHMGLAKGFIISLFLYPLLAAIFIVLFKNPLSSLSSLGAFSRYASGLVYYIHPAIILVANALLLTHTLKFLFVSVVCLVISLITYRISFMRKIV